MVISPFELNSNLNTLVVAPMTSNLRDYPTRVHVSFDGKEGRIAVDQIRAIDRRRVVKKLGKISTEETKNVKEVIRQAYVD